MMNCTRCNKRLSRKTARIIDGKVLCSTCMFAPAMKGDGKYWCSCVRCNEPYFGAKYSLLCPDCKAKAIKVQRAETGTGSVEDESAVPKGFAHD